MPYPIKWLYNPSCTLLTAQPHLVSITYKDQSDNTTQVNKKTDWMEPIEQPIELMQFGMHALMQ